MSERCGQVEPRWIRLKDIKWQGNPEPQPNFMIAYERCTSTDTDFHPDKCAWLCLRHYGLKLYSSVRLFIDGIELKEAA